MRKILLTLLFFITINIGIWASGTTAKSIASGDQYYGAYAEAKTNLATNTWVTTSGSPGNSATSYTAPSGWLASGSGKPGYGVMNVQSGKTVIFTVTNITGVSILGASNSSSRTINLSVKDNSTSTEVGTVATMTTASNSTFNVLTYGSTLLASKTYTITISASTTDNAKFAQIKFVGASSCAATAPGNISKGSACAGDDLTLTSAGSPASGDTWYWQASSTGTSTTNSGTTYDVSEAGTYYVRSYNTSGTCWSDAKSVTVAAGDWTSPSISGASSVTIGNTITLTGSPSGGTWNTSDNTKASVNSSGVVTGEAAGSANITYTKDGCTSDNHAVTVSAVVCSPSISASPSSANYCKDDVATALSFTGSGHNAQKWQYYDGDSWEDIVEATNATFTPSTSATGSTQYRVVTTCDSYTTTATSSAATVTVKTSPNLTISLAP